MAIDSSGQVSIRGEGSATTTNLQQGLAKCFIRISQPGVVTDSFNSSSSTDVDTGQHKNGYTTTWQEQLMLVRLQVVQVLLIQTLLLLR